MDELLAAISRGAWTQCWQITTLIAAVGIVAWLVGRNRPHLASALWLVVLLKCVTPPVVSCPCGVFCWLQHTISVVDSQPPAIAKSHAGEHHQSAGDDADAVVARLGAPLSADQPVEKQPSHPTLHSSSKEVARQSLSARRILLWSLAIAWLAGCAMSLGIMIRQFRSCWRQLTAAGQIHTPEVAILLEGLRRRLGLRGTVRLWVTPTLFGPAVIGIRQPTIILPAALLQGNSLSSMEPVLAHELMHIHRGDLWTSLVQTLAVACWWFYPLVRLASRWLTRELERCCDEEVIARLGCGPNDYARSLVEVLALKQQLQPVPVCPGVRPIDVTSQRLERIMRLGHGCHKRTPWWCWVAMLVLAITVLPGAALLARRPPSPAEPTRDQRWFNMQIEASDFLRLRNASPAAAAAEMTEPLSVRTLDVSDVLSEIRHSYVESDDMARKFLIHLLRYFVDGPRPGSENVELVPAKPSITWSDDKLLIRHTPQGHEWIDRQLAILREHGYAQLCVEVRVLSGPAAMLDAANADWQLIGGTIPAAGDNEDSHPGGQTMPVPTQGKSKLTGISGTVESVVERQVPAMVALVNDAQVRQLIDAAQNHPTTNIIFAPKITVFNGQSARIEDATQRPFVVGVKPLGEGKFEPQIRVVTEGTAIRLRPELHRDRRVHLDVGVTLSSVKDVETAQFPLGKGKEPIAVQVPEVTSMRVQSSVEMELDQSLAISIPAMRTMKKGQPSCILVRVYQIEEPLISSLEAPAATAAEEATRKPMGGELTAGQVVAKVGGDRVVLYDEIKPTVAMMRELIRAQPFLLAGEAPPAAQLEEQLTKQAIRRAADRKLLLNEFERTMPTQLRSDARKRAEVERKLKRNIQLAFDSSFESCRERIASASEEATVKMMAQEPTITRLALFMKLRGLETMPELDAALRPLGTSLQQQIDEFGESMLGREAVHTQIRDYRDTPREEAEQHAISRIRSRTTVWTIYDDPS